MQTHSRGGGHRPNRGFQSARGRYFSSRFSRSNELQSISVNSINSINSNQPFQNPIPKNNNNNKIECFSQLPIITNSTVIENNGNIICSDAKNGIFACNYANPMLPNDTKSGFILNESIDQEIIFPTSFHELKKLFNSFSDEFARIIENNNNRSKILNCGLFKLNLIGIATKCVHNSYSTTQQRREISAKLHDMITLLLAMDHPPNMLPITAYNPLKGVISLAGGFNIRCCPDKKDPFFKCEIGKFGNNALLNKFDKSLRININIKDRNYIFGNNVTRVTQKDELFLWNSQALQCLKEFLNLDPRIFNRNVNTMNNEANFKLREKLNVNTNKILNNFANVNNTYISMSEDVNDGIIIGNNNNNNNNNNTDQSTEQNLNMVSRTKYFQRELKYFQRK